MNHNQTYNGQIYIIYLDKMTNQNNMNNTNFNLMCFNNGVLDFNDKTLRSKCAEDDLTKSTNINYIPLDRKRDASVIAEIHEFVAQLFPSVSQREYMWEHFACILIGANLGNRTNVYFGTGCNGKTTLTHLLSMCLGDYSSDNYLSIIDEAMYKKGNADIVALNGIRLAFVKDYMGDDFVIRVLTSDEPIEGRDLLGEPVTFKPQFNIIVESNTTTKVDDAEVLSRINVVNFTTLFTHDPKEGNVEFPHQIKQDTTLFKKFPKWREVFMAMLVERAFVLQETWKF
jgi:phage/plasmid-associated DNA primase